MLDNDNGCSTVHFCDLFSRRERGDGDKLYDVIRVVHGCFVKNVCDTVDARNAAPPGMYKTF